MLATLAHKLGYTAAHLTHIDRLGIERELSVGINSKRHGVRTFHLHNLSILFLLVVERRKLAHESTVHIHRRCDEEECEQHERYVGSGGGVEYRHSVLSAFY